MGTWIIGTIVFGTLGLIIYGLYKDRKKRQNVAGQGGNAGCGGCCGCSGCK